MDTVYIETSIVSHATAWASPDPATAALQQQAKRWMDEQRPLYDVVTSQVVIDEAGMGDPGAAARRLQMLDELGLSGMLICTPIEFLGGNDDDT